MEEQLGFEGFAEVANAQRIRTAVEGGLRFFYYRKNNNGSFAVPDGFWEALSEETGLAIVTYQAEDDSSASKYYEALPETNILLLEGVNPDNAVQKVRQELVNNLWVTRAQNSVYGERFTFMGLTYPVDVSREDMGFVLDFGPSELVATISHEEADSFYDLLSIPEADFNTPLQIALSKYIKSIRLTATYLNDDERLALAEHLMTIVAGSENVSTAIENELSRWSNRIKQRDPGF